MTRFTSDFLSVLLERGFIHQGVNLEGLDSRAAAGSLVGYIGFDATAKSLHVGSLIQIMMLFWLQQTGHRPIVLMGGGTTKVGDPTGKDAQRQMLSPEDIADNIASIRGVFEKFLRFDDSPTGAVMVDNDDWLSALSYVEFLRDFGTCFTINRMLTFDSVRLRLERESPLTFLEFNYMLMQAYDFYVLRRRFGCVLQMGGSDQWGNIVNGVELCRRKDGAEVFGLTTPLLTTSSGKKMGKSEAGAVWLNADMLSPFEYWQFWRNTDDADVGVMLARFTTLPMDEVRRFAALGGAEINEAKKVLASEATAMLHGRRAADAALETARKTFEQGGSGEALRAMTVEPDMLAAGLPVLAALLETGLIASKSEGRRHIEAGAVRVNDAILSAERTLTNADLANGAIKLSVGKKKHALVRVGD